MVLLERSLTLGMLTMTKESVPQLLIGVVEALKELRKLMEFAKEGTLVNACMSPTSH